MKNNQLRTLTGKIVGTIAIASLGSLAVASKANAALIFTDTDSFTNERTDLFGMPELTVSKFTPSAGVTITEVQMLLLQMYS